MAAGVWEFKTWLRIGADTQAQARERAQEIADEVTDGPKDAQLSIEDDEPTFEEV